MTDDYLRTVWNKDRNKTITFKTVDYSLTEGVDGHTIFLNSSEQMEDWVRNFKATPQKVTWGGTTMYIHKGIHEAFNDLMCDLLPKLKNIRHLNITGVSHGGGIANLLHIWIKLHTNIIIKETVLFGAPKVIALWNVKGFRRAKNLCKDITFVRYGKDIVPTVPPWTMGYFRLKSYYKIKRQYKPKNIIEWFKGPFTDHSQYWEYLKDPKKKAKRRVY